MNHTLVTKDEFNNRIKVLGKTTIDHRIRLDFKLSLEEYVLMDFICMHNQTKKDIIKYSDYYKEAGFIKEDIAPLFKSLKDKDLLFMNPKESRVDVTQKWKDIFSSDGLIDKLWRLHPKGNKPTAKGRLPKVLKIITVEELVVKLKAYLKHCNDNNIYLKGLDVWLNPVKFHWDDPLVANPIKISGIPKITKLEVKFK